MLLRRPCVHAALASSLVLSTVLAAPPGADAEVFRLGPGDDVERRLQTLAPGDEVVLEDGTYTLTERLSFAAEGTPDAPIVIRAADGARPHFHRPSADQNIWDFSGTYLTVRGIVFSGGSAGLRVQGADHLTIEDCEIYETGDVALRMNDDGVTYRDVVIRRNHIRDTHGTGEGMYLGCNRDACRIAGGLVEGNYVHHTNAADVEQGDGIELKQGSHDVVIRDNVVHDTGYPCILGYGTAGNGGPVIVERNLLWNCGDHAIQWAADAEVRNNIVLSAAGAAFASQPHQGVSPANLRVLHNTFLNPRGDAVTVRSPAGAVLLANNALYSRDGRAILYRGDASMLTAVGNVGVGSLQGVGAGFTEGGLATDFVGARWSGTVPNDVYPAAEGGLVSAGAAEHVVSDDFDGTPRTGVADVGAYRYRVDGEPAWPLAEGFKDVATGPAGGGADGGVDGGAPPRADAGAVSDASTGRDASARPDGGEATSGAPSDGCGCRLSSPSPLATWAWPLVVVWLLGRRRRALR